MVSFSQPPIVFSYNIWVVSECVCCYLLHGGGRGEGGGKWLFVLSEPDLLIMVIVLTVTHKSDSDGNIITKRSNEIIEFWEILKGLIQIWHI